MSSAAAYSRCYDGQVAKDEAFRVLNASTLAANTATLCESVSPCSCNLADVLHATLTVEIGQEPTTSAAFPQPTCIEGLLMSINPDAVGTAEPSGALSVVRPS